MLPLPEVKKERKKEVKNCIEHLILTVAFLLLEISFDVNVQFLSDMSKITSQTKALKGLGYDVDKDLMQSLIPLNPTFITFAENTYLL